MAEAPVSKRGKWLARFAAAYPDDDDIRIEALRADISSGACARAKKTLFALAGRGDDIATVHPRLYECFMEYGRTMFLRKDHNEALAAFEMAMKKTTGDILIATKIK